MGQCTGVPNNCQASLTPSPAGLRHTVGVSSPHVSLPPNGAAATPEEAAAIVAAVERFMRATAPPAQAASERADGWRDAAMLEGVERDPGVDVSDPWINT